MKLIHDIEDLEPFIKEKRFVASKIPVQRIFEPFYNCFMNIITGKGVILVTWLEKLKLIKEAP